MKTEFSVLETEVMKNRFNTLGEMWVFKFHFENETGRVYWDENFLNDVVEYYYRCHGKNDGAFDREFEKAVFKSIIPLVGEFISGYSNDVGVYDSNWEDLRKRYDETGSTLLP